MNGEGCVMPSYIVLKIRNDYVEAFRRRYPSIGNRSEEFLLDFIYFYTEELYL